MKRLLILLIACSPNADVEEDLSKATLTYTLEGSALRFTEPALGAFVATTADGLVKVSGESRASRVRVDGQDVAVHDGRFETYVRATPGLNVVHGSASGIAGERAFVYGDFTKPGEGSAHGIVTRLNLPAFSDEDGELNDVSSIASYALSRVDLFDMLGKDLSFHYDFWLGSVDMKVTRVTYDGAASATQLTPSDVGAHASGHFGALGLDMALQVHVIGTLQGNAHVEVDRADFDSNVFTTLDRGVVEAQLTDLQLALGAIHVQTDLPASNYLDTIIEWVTDIAHAQVTAQVAAQVEQNAANYFAFALNNLALPSQIDVQGVSIASAWALDGLRFDWSGVTLSAAPALAWPEGRATERALSSPGSLSRSGAMPEMPTDSTVSMSLSFDMMNQATYAAWGQGGLDRQLWSGGKKWGVSFLPLVSEAALPPVLSADEHGNITLDIGDMMLRTGVSVLGFTGEVQARVSMAVASRLELTENALLVRVIGTPAISVDLNNMLGVVPDVAITAIEKLVEWLAPQIAEQLGAALAVPLPSLPLDAIKGFEGHALRLAAPATLAVDSERVLVNARFIMVAP